MLLEPARQLRPCVGVQVDLQILNVLRVLPSPHNSLFRTYGFGSVALEHSDVAMLEKMAESVNSRVRAAADVDDRLHTVSDGFAQHLIVYFVLATR